MCSVNFPGGNQFGGWGRVPINYNPPTETSPEDALNDEMIGDFYAHEIPGQPDNKPDDLKMRDNLKGKIAEKIQDAYDASVKAKVSELTASKDWHSSYYGLNLNR